MKVSAIQTIGVPRASIKLQKTPPLNRVGVTPIPEDTVSFQGKNTIAGASIGAIIGIGAITIISGGLATPVAVAAYTAAIGTCGGVLGHVVDKINEDNKKDKE